MLIYLFVFISIVIFLLILYNFSKQTSLQSALLSDISISDRNRILETGKVKMPDGGKVFLLTTSEDLTIRVIQWLPEKTSKGSILICQGFAELIEKYDEVVGKLLERGFAVLTFDWRGQGLSSRLLKDHQKAHILSFDDFIKDADLVYHKIFKKMPTPHSVIGHSMGGHLTFRLLQEYPHRFHRAILCAPLFGWAPGFGAGKVHPKLLLVISSLMKVLGYGQSYTYGAAPPKIEKALVGQTSDIQRFQKRISLYRKAPYVLLGGPTWNWVLECTKSLLLSLQDHKIKHIGTPTLLASGAKDAIVNPLMHHQVAQKHPLIFLHDFPNALHEILIEKDSIQTEFWKIFDDFMGD